MSIKELKKLLKKFRKEVCIYEEELEEEYWGSLAIGWALAQGLGIEEAKDAGYEISSILAKEFPN